MDPQRTLATLFDQIRRKLRIPRVFNSGLLGCALCGERVATMRQEIHEETDGGPICQSCFQLVLKKAAQIPERIVRKLKEVS